MNWNLCSVLTLISIKYTNCAPRSPHFGELWETGVKSVKHHLKRVLGTHIVNSRPITELSNDLNDLNPLTPAHFLVGQSLASFPVPDASTLNINRLDHWQRIQQLYQIFLRRWSDEYLSTPQQQTKWVKDYTLPSPGSLVLIKEDFWPPIHWDLGHIVELHNGSDGVSRDTTILTAKGLMKRALVKLCVLADLWSLLIQQGRYVKLSSRLCWRVRWSSVSYGCS